MKNQIMYDGNGNEVLFIQKLKKGFLGIPLDIINSQYGKVIIHGSTPDIIRSSSSESITWVGTVEPLNAIDNDIWKYIDELSQDIDPKFYTNLYYNYYLGSPSPLENLSFEIVSLKREVQSLKQKIEEFKLYLNLRENENI